MKKKIALMVAFGCLGASAASANYDILGRKGSKMNSPMVYKNVDYSKVEKNEQKLNSSLETKALAKQASGIKNGAKAIVGKFRPDGYGFASCSSGSGCGQLLSMHQGSLSWSDYSKKVNDAFIKIVSHEKPRHSTDYHFETAGPSRSSLSGYGVQEFSYNVYGNVTHAASFNKKLEITYYPISTVINNLNWSALSKTNVGVYLDEEAVPVRLNRDVDPYAPFILADNASKNDFNTMPGYEMRASRMYKLVHVFSSRSAVYAAKGQPLNPADATKGPQIYMGLHGYGGSANSSYSTKAKDLDNYIYNNRTVEIVGAGNTAGNLSAKAFALNAITVGALDPDTKQVTSYSAKNLPKYCSSCGTYIKPEIENYSNFYNDDYYRSYSKAGFQTYEYYPYYDGTEAAAGVTAGMVSNMLSNNEFYKWHPEVVKAVILNAENSISGPINYNKFVYNQYKEHQSYYFIGDVNTLMKTYNDHPPIQDVGDDDYDGKKEIRFNFGRSALSTSMKGFCTTISWLNSGNDIAKLGKLPQNFEIFVYTRSGNPHASETISGNGVTLQATTARDYDQSKNSPYKTLCVDSRSTDAYHELTIRIVLGEEDSRSENYGQMVLGMDVMPYYN